MTASQFLCTSKSVDRLVIYEHQHKAPRSVAYYAGNNNSFMTVDTRRISHSNGVTSFKYRSHPFLRCESSDGAGSASEGLFLEVLSPLIRRDRDNGKATLASAMVLRVEDVSRRLRSALRSHTGNAHVLRSLSTCAVRLIITVNSR